MDELTDQKINDNKAVTNRFPAEIDATLLVWLAFLALGGSILSLYYAHIGYLPDVEWSSSIVYLAIASLIGGGVGLLLALSLLIPGCIWAVFLLADEKLKHAFCFRDDGAEFCLLTLLWRIGRPFGVVLLLNHFVLFLCGMVLGESYFYGWVTLLLYGVFSVVALYYVGCYMRRIFGKMLNQTGVSETDPDRARRIFKYVTWFVISVLLSQISMILIYLLYGRPTGWPFIFITLFCTLGVLVSNHVVAIRYHRSRIQASAVSLMIALLLLLMADRNAKLSSQIMAFYGVGDKSDKVVLVLNDDGIKIVERLRLPNGCGEPFAERVCGVQVLSRLGHEYYLDVKGRRFTLPKSAVASWELLGK